MKSTFEVEYLTDNFNLIGSDFLFRLKPQTKMPTNCWLSLFELQHTAINNNQYLWLSDHSSMTNRLNGAGLTPLKIDLISASCRHVAMQEREFLDLPPRQWPFLREVIMHVDNKPWLYGRTVIPQSTLAKQGRQLALLKAKPLGRILFEQGDSARLFIEVAAIDRQHHLFPQHPSLAEILHTKKRLWARRSLFSFGGNFLMVQEVFLPNCPFSEPV